MNTLTVVLNAYTFSVPELINQSRLWAQRVTDHASSFPSCVATAAKVLVAASELETADEAATDGAKTAHREKNDKRKKLIAVLVILGHQVEQDANGDESIVHLAGMEVKRRRTSSTAEFSAKQGEGHGSVKLKVKARENSMYKWQYATDPGLASWIDAGISRVSRKAISNLSSGVYWFRVVFLDNEGEHNGEAYKFAVT